MYYDKRERNQFLTFYYNSIKIVTFYMYFVVMYEGGNVVKRKQSLEEIYSEHMQDLFRYLLS